MPWLLSTDCLTHELQLQQVTPACSFHAYTVFRLVQDDIHLHNDLSCSLCVVLTGYVPSELTIAPSLCSAKPVESHQWTAEELDVAATASASRSNQGHWLE